MHAVTVAEHTWPGARIVSGLVRTLPAGPVAAAGTRRSAGAVLTEAATCP